METPDFSPVLGGPLFQLYRRTLLCGNALELLRRRLLIIPLFTWLPLLFLSMFDGYALGGSLRVPFLYDIEAHVRFLIALPLLIIVEVVVHRRLTPLGRRLVDRGIVVTKDLPKFNEAARSAQRACNSVGLEVALLIVVFTVGLWTWRSSHLAAGRATWYAVPDGPHLRLTLAGYWYAFVSIPVFQFILLRWYGRLVLWFRFLWRVSKLDLHLTAAHPDRAGGIGFLGKSSYAFGLLAFAQGALLAGLIANRILYEGQDLVSFKMEAAGLIALLTLFILGPLLMFTPLLALTKRQGLAQYGLLANRYVFGFEEKWLGAGAQETSELLGTGDIQSLADLANSYSIVREMRGVPFGLEEVTRLAAIAAAPLLPLTLTIFSLEELLIRLAKIIF